MSGFGQRVCEAVRAKGTPAMVGLDPRPDLLPAPLVSRYGLARDRAIGSSVWSRATEEFCSRVLDVVAPWVPVVKFQSACYELFGAAGIDSLRALMRKARRRGLITILDVKRGDIGSTSEAYAQASFGQASIGSFPIPESAVGDADAITVSPYLGRDSLDPFLQYVERGDRGLFVLVRTSNRGAVDLQHLSAGQPARPVYSHVAEWVRQWSESTRGAGAYGSVGAVVGATAPEQIAELRAAMPSTLLLLPGYGTQGARSADIAAAFDSNGLGALVNNSRGVLFPSGSADSQPNWEAAIETAVKKMVDDLARHTPAAQLRSN